jgi:hypothetical protein
MGQHTVQIKCEADKVECKRLIDLSPVGTYVRYTRNVRTIPQNSRLWALLSTISVAMRWNEFEGYHTGLKSGEKYSPEEWKDYFCHMLRGNKFMPDEHGREQIPVGMSTRSMTKDEHNELQALIEAFAVRFGIGVRDIEK